MPIETPIAPLRKTPIRLAALTALVLLAHAGLLFGTPVALVSPVDDLAGTFSTRMIEPPVAAPAAPAMLMPVQQRAPLVAPRPRAQTAQPQFAAPAILRDDGGMGPMSGPAVADNVVGVLGVTPQLLAADDPPGNLKPNMPPVLLASAGVQTSPTPSPARAASTKAAQSFVFPPTMHLKYKINGEVKGFQYYVNGDLRWTQDGKTYDARMAVSHFLLGSRVQTSRGDLGATGLEPIRFGDKVRSEVAAHFDRSKGKVTFSANTPDAPLLTGTQDQLSALVQLGSMLGGSPASFPEGTSLAMEAVGPRSVESWVFKVGPQEKLTLPGGPVSAIKLVREAAGEYGTRAEIWLAPSMGYLPVRIRLMEANGNFIDQKWSDTVSP